MATYQRMLKEFERQGLAENSQVTYHEVKAALDSITLANTAVHEFDPEVATEIWNETEENNAGNPIMLRDYVATMVRAENILRGQVETTQAHLNRERDEKERQQLLNDLFSFSKDHRILTAPFGLEQLRESKQLRQSKQFSSAHRVESQLFGMEVDERQKSTDLLITLIVTLILFALELILMFHKHHFFNLMCLFMVASAYVLNYFEKKYVLMMIGAVAASLALDLVWIIVHAGEYWNPPQQTQHSTIQTGFLRFIVFMVCATMIAKGVLVALLLKYRTVGEHVGKKVQFFGFTFHLDGNPDPHNLFLKAF